MDRDQHRLQLRRSRLAPNGLRRLKLKAGSAGRASIAVEGRGATLGMPALPLAPGVSVQLVNLETGLCSAADHDVVLIGRDDVFRAKGD